MQESITSNAQQIPVGATLDVQAVERELNELWMQNAGGADEEGAMLRARVLNLMVYVASEQALGQAEEILLGLAAAHPCRALVMLADPEGKDKDIEMHVSSRCQRAGGAGARHLCCEQVTVRASGRFTVELPSVSVPLLVSDLPVFLWWQGAPGLQQEIFKSLRNSADRVVIDSAASLDPYADLRALASLLKLEKKERRGLSDLNWARLTTWRALLAGFYDVPEHREALSRLSRVRIEYIAPEAAPDSVAPRALLLAGWLASRLGWRATSEKARVNDGVHLFSMEQDGRTISVEFKLSGHTAVAPGGIARVELVTDSDPQSSFVAMRAEDSRDLKTQQATDADTRTSRVVTGAAEPTEAELLAAELEILRHDHVYEEAVAKAAEMLGSV
jgi:glucose-6-phosphate dehydrogenase assembly protein OpcA